MALGNGGFVPQSNTENNKKNAAPEVYCPIIMKNPTAKVDPSELSFSYWKNLLKISVSPKLENTGNVDYVQYDHTNNVTIFINAAKAAILAKEIREMLAAPEQFNSVGVNSGKNGLITFANGKEYGVEGYVLVIRKIDDTGVVTSSYVYQFNREFYYSIRNFEETTAKFDRKFYDEIEIEQFISILEGFAQAQNYAVAYTVVDSMKFDVSRINTKIESIMGNLGIQVPKKGTQGSKTSFFDSSKNAATSSEASYDAGYGKPSATNTTSLDDIAGELE